MKAHLLASERDAGWQWVRRAAEARESARTGRRYRATEDEAPAGGLPWNADALTADLGLETLFDAMAEGDDWVFEAARATVLAGVTGDRETVRYRQAVLRDCLDRPAVVRALYAVAVESMDQHKRRYLGILGQYPDSVLRDAIEVMSVFRGYLKRLRRLADAHAGEFRSTGWSDLFSALKRDLDDDYLRRVDECLDTLRFRSGELVSAELAVANKGACYTLHRVARAERSWRARWNALFAPKLPSFRFSLHPRDEAGMRALAGLRNRGLAPAANALAQSADHVRDFLAMLRVELAFYVGCINLRDRLARDGLPLCFPDPMPPGDGRLAFRDLYDPGLALKLGASVVGNDAEMDGKRLVVVTGANAGGKSTFLRSLGIAQLMMQSGMFVPATRFGAALCDGLYTHFKREEDAGMVSGKLEEELKRMREIVDRVNPASMVLLNESFAATNEREGSELARQIIAALVERGVRVACVTHLYELAHGFYRRGCAGAAFLRADREANGSRSFKMIEGEPLATSHGADLYRRIFAVDRT